MDEIYINNLGFSVSAAVTESEQSIGLMWKSWPPPVLMFPYKKSAIRKFWMKNTPSPLDIVFCRDGKIISICKGEPNSTMMIGPDEPADLVIEFPYGTIERNGFVVGDEVKVKYSTPTAAKIVVNGLL